MRSLALMEVVAATLPLLAAPAMALPEGEGGGGGAASRRGADPAARWQQFVDQMDADKDGKISRAEFGKAREALRMDRNEDGAITKDEMQARTGGAGAPRAEQWFEKMDTNKDGKVSGDEIAKAREEQFARMDGDGDGFLSEKEWQSARGAMRRGGAGKADAAGAATGPAPGAAGDQGEKR